MSKEHVGKLSKYKIKKQIGKGSYGTVFLVDCRESKKQYVMKSIDLASATGKSRLAAEQEANLLSRLQHPNIVSYKESFQDIHGVLNIVMGYCEGGDLSSRLKAYGSQLLPETQVVEWFVQIALALQYLHERNILHRDLKTQNIFLSKTDIVKVGDLGIARVLDGTCDLAHTIIGTPYYMSPELFANQPYNQKSDIWALGCCVYEMASLKHAFSARNIESLMCKVIQGRVPPLPSEYSRELADLVRVMLAREPEQRPTVHQILRNSFIRTHIRMFIERTAHKKRKVKSSKQLKSGTVQPRLGGTENVDGSLDVVEDRQQPVANQQQDAQHGDKAESQRQQQDAQHGDKAESQRQQQDEHEDLPQDKKKSLEPHNISSNCSNNKDMEEKWNEGEVSASAFKDELKNNSGCIDESTDQSKPSNASATNMKAASELSLDQNMTNLCQPVDSLPTVNHIVKVARPLPPDPSSRDEQSTSKDVSSARMRRRRSKRHDSAADNALRSHSDTHISPEEKVDIDNRARKTSSSTCIDGCSSKEAMKLEEGADLTDNGHTSTDQSQPDEVEDLCTLLDSTLRLPESENIDSNHLSSSADILLPSGRLADRARSLRQECEGVLGVLVVQHVLDMLTSKGDTEEIEEELKTCLGLSNFNLHSAKLQQLKLCEDSLNK